VDLVRPSDVPVVRICGQRDEAVRKIREAAELIARGRALAVEASTIADGACENAHFALVDRSLDAHFKSLFERFDPAAAVEVFRRHTDARVWMHLLQRTGLEHLMDASARDDFFKALSDAVPEVNEDRVYGTLAAARADSKLTFQRGLARTFAELDRRFRSHDAFKLGARIVLTHVFDSFGSFNNWSRTGKMIGDVERVLSVLDGKEPAPGALMEAINMSRGSRAFGARQGVCETPYLRIRTFKNGNAHLWFTRDDLVEKANLMLADYYGEVLPDAAERDADPVPKSGLPARDLSFYPTPQEVVDELLRDLHVEREARVLEPSAGDGAIVVPLLGDSRNLRVSAVEIDPGRVAKLSAIGNRRLQVLPGNFLQMPVRPDYDAVVMNPPFYGTHWMEHVQHAFKFLRDGGVLRTVLPATAEVAESAAHVAFRAWAKPHANTTYDGEVRFRTLPPESFASSGTRINTVILELRK